jgi:hypothetical protein
MLRRFLSKYWHELETMLYDQISPTNHITHQLVSLESFRSIGMSWSQCSMIEYRLQITLQINESEKSTVKILRPVRDNLWSSTAAYRSYFRSIRLIRFVSKNWHELETMLHHGTFTISHITNESVSPQFCWSIEVSWSQCYITKYPLQITLRTNQFHQSSVGVLRWAGKNASSWSIH